MNYEAPELSDDEVFLLDKMEDIRDEIISGLSKLERAALFNNLEVFRREYEMELARDYD